MKKRDMNLLFISLILILIFIPFVSAGFSEWIKSITGKATDQALTLNISVGVPRIITVYNASLGQTTLNMAPSNTNLTINFSVYYSTKEWLNIWYIYSAVLAFLVSAVFNFTTNKFWTFRKLSPYPL